MLKEKIENILIKINNSTITLLIILSLVIYIGNSKRIERALFDTLVTLKDENQDMKKEVNNNFSFINKIYENINFVGKKPIFASDIPNTHICKLVLLFEDIHSISEQEIWLIRTLLTLQSDSENSIQKYLLYLNGNFNDVQRISKEIHFNIINVKKTKLDLKTPSIILLDKNNLIDTAFHINGTESDFVRVQLTEFIKKMIKSTYE